MQVHAFVVSVLPSLPLHVQRAFRLSGDPVALPGGAGTSVRVGGAVLKPVQDEQEAIWAADLLSRISEDGFRVARPLRARDGAWVVDGWCAHSRVEGKSGPEGRWDELLAAARAFHAALLDETRPGFLAHRRHRRHRWAVADRVAWREEPADPVREVEPLLNDLLAELPPNGPLAVPRLIHGDLSGNVLFAPGLPPAVIDFSPYWRPLTYASAIVAVDGVLWYGAGQDLLQRVAHEAGSVQDLVRALVFRLIALNERARFDPVVLDELPQFAAAASMIELLDIG